MRRASNGSRELSFESLLSRYQQSSCTAACAYLSTELWKGETSSSGRPCVCTVSEKVEKCIFLQWITCGCLISKKCSVQGVILLTPWESQALAWCRGVHKEDVAVQLKWPQSMVVLGWDLLIMVYIWQSYFVWDGNTSILRVLNIRSLLNFVGLILTLLVAQL